MDEILEALGAEVVPFEHKAKCCGSGIFFTEMETCAPLAGGILGEAEEKGADMIVTACPMCQMNLEIYQPRLNKMLGTEYDMPGGFRDPADGLAFGGDFKKDAALDRNIVSATEVLKNAAA